MPGIKSEKLGWNGVPKTTLFDPEPGFRWVRFRLTSLGGADSVVSSARVPEGATPEQVREQIVQGSKLDLAKVKLEVMAWFARDKEGPPGA